MASRTRYELEILLGARQAASFRSQIRSAENALHGIDKTAKRVAGLATAAFAAVNIKDFVADSVGEFQEFEKSLDNTAATFRATESEYADLQSAARDAGKQTIKTATESSEALGYMALAGWDVDTSISNLMPILKTSVASNLDLAETSDLVTDSVSALNVPLSKLPEYLDTVIQGNDNANMTSQQMMKSFILAGGAARTLEIGYRDLGTAIGVLANNGTKDTMSGTALNAMLTRIASNDNAIAQMKKLGISIFDAEEDFVGLEEALKRIDKGVSDLTVEKKAAALKQIAGTQYYSKMTYLLDSVKNGAKGAQSAWDELEADLEDSDGALDRKYDKMTDNLDGHLETMKSAFSDMQISFGDAFDDELIYIVDGLGEVFNDLSENITEFSEENEIAIHNFVEGCVEGVGTAGEYIGEFAGFVMENGDYIIAVVKGITAAFAAEKLVDGIMNFGMSLTTLASNPVGLAVAGIAALTMEWVAISNAIKVANERAAEADLENHFGNISLSLEQIDEVAQEIVGKKQLTKITEMLEAMGETSDAVEGMSDSLSNIREVEWKIDAGLKIRSDDREKYISSVKDYIEEAQNVIDSRGYTVSLSTELLLGKNSSIGLENNEFYADLDKDMEKLEKQLNKKLEKAVEKGVNVRTDGAIQKLLGKISKITNAITESENQAELDSLKLKYSGKDLDADTFQRLSKDIAKYEKKADEGFVNAYKDASANLNYRLAMGDIDEAQFSEESQKLQQGYFQKKADAYAHGYDFVIKSIQEAYPEVKSAMQSVSDELDAAIKDGMEKGLTGDGLNSQLSLMASRAMASFDLPKSTRDAVKDMLESGLSDMLGGMSELKKEMNDANVDIPASLQNNLSSIWSLSTIGGSVDDTYALLGDKIGRSSEYMALVGAAEKAGGSLPDGMQGKIREKTPDVVAAVQDMYNAARSSVSNTIYLGEIKLTTSMAEGATNARKAAMNLKSHSSTYTDKHGKDHTIYRNALGGVYDKEILTTVSEEGRESIIPWNNSPRSKMLLKQTADGMGFDLMPKSSGVSRDAVLLQGLQRTTTVSGTPKTVQGMHGVSGAPVIHYSPQVIIQGNADGETVVKALDISRERFAELMEQWTNSNKRVKFG